MVGRAVLRVGMKNSNQMALDPALLNLIWKCSTLTLLLSGTQQKIILKFQASLGLNLDIELGGNVQMDMSGRHAYRIGQYLAQVVNNVVN